MNAEQLTTYAQALIASVTIGVIVPLLILAVMMLAIWRLILMAQRKATFHIEEIFLDENGKTSATRFTMLMGFAFSCWWMSARMFSGHPDPTEFYAFLAAWSSSVTLLKLADKWNGVMPFAKGAAAPE
jgi:hypothetical protein